MNSKGQITIFVIVGILLAVGIVFLFSFDRTPSVIRGQDLDNPESYIDNCIKEQAEKEIINLMAHGGFPDSTDTVLYKGIAIPYLCKNINYYQPCIVQYPRYVTEIKNEFIRNFEDDVEQCFASLEQELTDRNYIIDAGPITLSANIKPKITHINVERDFTLTKGDSIKSYTKFDFFINTRLYELALIVQEIVSQEAQMCDFETDEFMKLYPAFDISKDVLEDSTNIYTVKHKSTEKKMTFATRGCARPPGIE
ncbi:hypothetical protein EXS72_02865 [Candidatus Pacearchaeota archaeon]|nr:hypothetical protein [Candidatus Pacearchaeota archaeon]